MKSYVRRQLFRPSGTQPQTQVVLQFIDDEKCHYGVELICRILPITPSTYYRIKHQQANPEKQSRRMQNDTYITKEIEQVCQDSCCLYGVLKVWHQLKKIWLCFDIARCTVKRLMKNFGIQGVWRCKGKMTTKQRDDQKFFARL